MSQTTTYMGLATYDPYLADKTTLGKDYVDATSGTAATSNMNVIDAFMAGKATYMIKTAAAWAADTTTILRANDFGVASDTCVIKRGDGTNTWTNLPTFDPTYTNFVAAGYDGTKEQFYALLESVSTHGHGSITNDGKIGSAANLAVFTGTNGVLETKSATDARTALGAAAATDIPENSDFTLAGLSEKSYTNLTDKPSIPTATSDLTNDSGFISSYTETDPTVPSWAKAATKPTYSASEVGAVPTARTVNGKALSEDISLTASDVGLEATTAIDTLADGDKIILADVSAEAGSRTKHALWSAIKSTLKSYFDALYTAALLALTGYTKPASTSAIAASDTINAAIGKLEKGLDEKQASPTTLTALPASGTALADNTIYNVADAVGTYVFTPPATGQAHGKFTTAATVAISFATGATFIGAAPTIEASKTYEFDVLNGVWAVQGVVA